jgi:hypothetical protein
VKEIRLDRGEDQGNGRVETSGQRETGIGTSRGRTMCGQQSVLVGTIRAKNGRANRMSRNVRITQLQVLTATEESG